MKPKRLRSMRDIPTIQGMKNRAVPANREQMISEFARLEHEKARLERELSIWQTNQKKTEERIHQIQERLNMLQSIFSGPDTAGQPHRQGGSHQPRSSPDEVAEENSGFHEISIEY